MYVLCICILCIIAHAANPIYIRTVVSHISLLTPKSHPLRSKVPINLYTKTYLVHSPTQVTKYTFSRPDLWAICERQFGRQKSPSFSSGFHADPAVSWWLGMSAMLKVHKHEIFFLTFFAETKTIWSQGPVTRDFWKSYSIRPRYSTFKHFRACSACDEIGSKYAQHAMKIVPRMLSVR